MNNTPKMTRKYKYARLRYEIELENISHVQGQRKKKYKNIQLSLTLSIVSIFMSLALMAGTTYAWFTSTISNTGNVIQSGYVEAELLAQKGEEIINLSTTNAPAFNVSNLSPTNDSTETMFTVSNKGTLPFKCFMYFYGIDNTSDPDNLASQIKVYTKDVDDSTYTYKGLMSELIVDTTDGCVFYIDRLDATKNKSINVKLCLKEQTDTSYASKGLSFNIKLVAKQISE